MRRAISVFAALLLGGDAAHAAGPGDFIAAFAAEARRADASFVGFSAERGARFFGSTRGGDWSCATCHGATPTGVGEHVVTGKRIEPLAPAANPQRFTDAAKVDKWFARNCNDVVKRPCTSQEKGDVLAWLMSLPGEGRR
jgi:hypothetical protein